MSTNESAPEPTAGERRLCGPCRRGQTHVCDGNEYLHCDNAATPDADDASTEASEGLTEDERPAVVTLHDKALGLAWSCTCGATGAGATDPVRKAAREHQRTHLDPWLAAREAKARADERERIALPIEALPGPSGVGLARWTHSKAKEGYLLAIEEAAGVARIAREARP